MDDIREDLKRISTELTTIKVIMAANTATLEEHVKRTELAETRIQRLEYLLIGMLASVCVASIVKLLN